MKVILIINLSISQTKHFSSFQSLGNGTDAMPSPDIENLKIMFSPRLPLGLPKFHLNTPYIINLHFADWNNFLFRWAWRNFLALIHTRKCFPQKGFQMTMKKCTQLPFYPSPALKIFSKKYPCFFRNWPILLSVSMQRDKPRIDVTA